MRIIIDGNGRIDRQAMAVERLKTIDMTPDGGGDAQDWVGAWLDGFDQAFDRLMQEHKKERETEGARP